MTDKSSSTDAGTPVNTANDDGLRCTCFRVRRAARRLTQAYEAALSDCDLSPVQMTVLAELDRSAPVSVVELAERLGTDRTTLSRTVARMMDAGWIADGPAADGRARGLMISEDGKTALYGTARSWRRAETAVARRLGAERLDALYALLCEVETAANDIEAAIGEQQSAN